MFASYRTARKPVQQDATQKIAVDALIAVLAQLSNKDQQFANSLIAGFNRFGKLSDKQMPWVDTLTQRAIAPKPAPVAYVSVDFKPIQDMFDLAAQKLKRIKVKIQDTTGQSVVFNRAGANSKYAGQIMITDGKPFGENKFFGRIDTTGEFFATRLATQQICEAVKEFSDDPAGSAAKYGRLTGGCSFCKQGLTDKRSLAVGYGPVCAKNFGLAWG
jgi:hypothetical protein